MSSSGQQQKRRRKSNNTRGASSNRTPRGNGKAPASNTWVLTPVSILLRTMSYLDNATVMLLCLVCKQLKELIWNGNGMETKLIRVFELHLQDAITEDAGTVRVRRFIANMDRYLHDATTNRLLQQYQHWKIRHGEFSFSGDEKGPGFPNLAQLTQNMSMPGILSLDTSLLEPIQQANGYCSLFLESILHITPNLQELDLSNLDMGIESIHDMLSKHCPQLEILKWNFNKDDEDRGEYMSADGRELESMDNLRELYLDNRMFGLTTIRNRWII